MSPVPLILLLLALVIPTTHVVLRTDRTVYPLATLATRQRLIVEGSGPPLCKLALARPLAPGRWELHIEGPADADRTVVFSLPVAGGEYTFVVSATGRARYDFVLEGPPGHEYRAAVLAPVRDHVFRATLPGR
jgi:hypothetical protein